MQRPGEDDCCSGVPVGVLNCAGNEDVHPIDENRAWLFGATSDSPVLAWREDTEGPWNFSDPRRLFVESGKNPLFADPSWANQFSSAKPTLPPTKDGTSWWLLELKNDRNDAPFVRKESFLTDYPAYPVAIVRSLDRAHPPSKKPWLLDLLSLFGTREWPWSRIGVKRATAGDRFVRLAILDDGYYADDYYDSFVEAYDQQNFSDAATLTNSGGSHGAACLLFAAEVVKRSEGGAGAVTLVPYRVFGDKPCATEDLLLEALSHAADNSIDIVVAPWLIRQQQTRLESVVAALSSKGILFLTGPANKKDLDLDDCACGQEMAHWQPGTNIGVVGAVGQKDVWPVAFGATTVDVGAPGSSIYNRLTGLYESGSSFATPIAAGVVAIELSRQPKERTALDVWGELLEKADPCQANHPSGPHCASKGIISFPEK